MRHIGTLPDETQARTYIDYVLVRGVKGTVERDADGWAVWIYDDDQVELASKELAEFRTRPDDPKYAEGARQAAALRRDTEKKRQAAARKVVDVRESWNRPLHQRIPVTFLLAATCIGVTIASDFGKRVEPVREWLSLAKIIDAGGGTVYIPVRGHTFDDVLEGQVWRLVTPMFLHFTFLHIAFNVYWLLALGGMVETRLGKWKLIGLVLIFAIVGNVAQGAWSGPMFGGVSGVNYGLFGFVWMRGRYVPESGLGISPNSAVFFMLWFILGFTGSVGPIANLAHWGGLVPGLFLGYAPKLLRDLRRP